MTVLTYILLQTETTKYKQKYLVPFYEGRSNLNNLNLAPNKRNKSRSW